MEDSPPVRVSRPPLGHARSAYSSGARFGEISPICVSEGGLEPPCPKRALAPQASASAYSATRTGDAVHIGWLRVANLAGLSEANQARFSSSAQPGGAARERAPAQPGAATRRDR